MNEFRGHFEEIKASQERDRLRRVQENAATTASSLAELARWRYEQEEQAKADEEAERRSKQEALREDFLARISARGRSDLPELVGRTFDLPEDHWFITGLDWQLVTGPYSYAQYSETPDAGIQMKPTSDRGPEETFETTIDGRRIQATFSRSEDREPRITLLGVTENSSHGLRNIVDLGKFLSEQAESDSTTAD